MRGLIGSIYFLCAAAMILVLAGSTGCAPTLSAQSAAPPGRSARLDEVTGFMGHIKSYRLELSAGVALALTCTRGGPCEKMTVISDDPKTVEVRAASLSKLEPSGLANQATSSAVVVVGKVPGKALLRLSSKEGKREIAVTVIAPPTPTPPATVAR